MFGYEIDRIIQNALGEDIAGGDITTESCIPESAFIRGRFLAKEEGVVCGLEVMGRVFALLDPNVKMVSRTADGQRVSAGDILAEIEGNARPVLTGERTALNLLQHMSGIATYTARAVESVEGTGARIVDTRKTTPGLRVLDKYAVRTGGGYNHRMGLYDGILIKDNHIAAAGGILPAVKAVRERAPHTLRIEVEVSSPEEIGEALEARSDIIMLDNMTDAQMTEAVALVAGRALTEASGNVTVDRAARIAATGVDLVSSGALTHSVRAMDISMRFD